MEFQLSQSPLRNFWKYDADNVFDLLVPFAKRFVSVQHDETNKPLPPVAFVLKGDQCLYFNGYWSGDAREFLALLVLEAEQADAVVTLAELGSIENDYSDGLLLVCVQTRSFYRCRVFRLAHGDSFPVLEGPLRIELPRTSEHREEEDNICYLTGLDFLFHSFFV